ncbi:MAG: FHA domain-containing protein [Kofleriaceae bacterium]
MRPIELYRPELEVSKADFVRVHTRPFLIYSQNPSRESTPVDARLMTIDRFVVDGNRPSPFRETIVATELVARDPDEKKIVTIGAAPTSDIVINDNSLSKQHAWFARSNEAYEAWQLWDNDSVGGTQVNAQLLKPGFPQALQSGDVITLGYVEMTFLTADAFYSLVKHLLR